MISVSGSGMCRENIEKDMEVERRRADNPDVMEEDVDQVPCITRAHFEEVILYTHPYHPSL